MSLHTNETCIITGDSSVMTGELENTNCAYYPNYNVGCGVSDPRTTSFGKGFNQAGGGVYAMQWTSESILIWYWPRAEVPEDVDNKKPDPGSWGLPAAQLGVGNCKIDEHFQSHKIIFDTTFCGEYAGSPFVWKTDDGKSCAGSTGLATCDSYVANFPEAFEDAYWSVNYVRVYQLDDPESDTEYRTYIASEQAPSTATQAVADPVSTPNLAVDELCPTYNFSVITDGKYKYEVACDFDPPGPDIVGQPYPGFKVDSLADCVAGCTYMNENNGTNKCGGVAHSSKDNFCYFKKFIQGTPQYRKGFNQVRLIYYGYPQITDDPRSTADSTLTSIFIETIPTPQTYRPLTITTRPSVTTTSSVSETATSREITTLPPAMGGNSTSTSSEVPPDYSETATLTGNATSTATSLPSSVTSTDPQVTNSEFYIVFNVDTAAKRLTKRAIQFLAFDENGYSKLVTTESEATKFWLTSDGSLMAGDLYVGVNTGQGRLQLSDDAPAEPFIVTVSEEGDVSVPDAPVFCLTESGALAIGTDEDEVPVNCTRVEPELLGSPDSSTSTSTSSTTTIRTGGLSTSTTSGSSSFQSDSTRSTPTASTSPSSASSNPGTASGTTSSSSTGTSTTAPTASTINDFVYAGCFGIPTDISPASLPGLSLPLTSDTMTNEKCTAACKNITNAYFAATHDEQCFCSTSMDLYDILLDYPDASCNIRCPGANRQFCGGTVQFEGGLEGTSGAIPKRQNTNLILVSLYNNTLLIDSPGEDDVPTTTDSATTTRSGIGGGTVTDTETDTITVTATSTSTSSSRITTTSGPLYFDPEDVIYNVTGTNTVTVISTDYVDLCPTCAAGLTTRSTTITVPDCGCTASYDKHLQKTVPVAKPTVPMMTTVKHCKVCAETGGKSVVTLTVPHTSSIKALAAMVTQMAMHSAVPAGGSTMPVAGGGPGSAVHAGHTMAPANGVAPVSGPAAMNNASPASGAAPANAMNAAALVNGASKPASGSAPAAAPIAAPIAAPGAVSGASAAAPMQNLGTTTTPTAGPVAPIGMRPEASNNNVAAAAAANNPPAAAAPASPPSVPNASAATHGNLTAPKVPSVIANGTIPSPIASFTSSASRLIRIGAGVDSLLWWSGSRYALSIAVGVVVTVVVGAW
ncbi:hypothetical protein LTR64_003899 [Lithohypha guttulata]|uniref:uncharacterized protein n=1 Tax=Lithohypha guttulata TaxID=1690604 RepID=UPI00315DB574